MRTITLLIFLMILTEAVWAQEQNSDSTILQKNLDRFINREFVFSSQDERLTALEAKYRTPLNSLAKCLAIFSTGNSNENELAILTARIEEIAKRLFDEGTPIYLSIGGTNSVEWTNEKNRNRPKNKLTYVSLGNYCVVGKGEAEFERTFNKKTLQLLGVERVE